MRKVIVESPYAGDVATNEAYAERCVVDCLRRGEAPLASHLLYTSVLRDAEPEERKLGIGAGLAWYGLEVTGVFYLDRGLSNGMLDAVAHARRAAGGMETRFLRGLTDAERTALERDFPFRWEPAAFGAPSTQMTCEMAFGRLQVAEKRRPPTRQAPWEASYRGTLVAHYMTQDDAKRGAEMYYLFNHLKDVPASAPDWLERLIDLDAKADLNTKSGIATVWDMDV